MINYSLDDLQVLFEEFMILKGANYDRVMDMPVTDEFIEETLSRDGYSDEEIQSFLKGL